MKSSIKFLIVIAIVLALGVIAVPAHAASGGATCVADPGSGPIGTTFGVACKGFSPNTWLNVYAVEPDGRASGIDIYGFFPTSIKTDASGTAGFAFVTEVPGFASVPAGDYIFVVHELALGNSVRAEVHLPVTVTSKNEAHVGAWLNATVSDHDVAFWGGGFTPWAQVNPWVTQPEGSKCSGLGIDQLTLGALGAGSSSLWFGPTTVKADGAGNIAFSMHFNPSACIGTYSVTVRDPGTGIAGEASFAINGNAVVETAGTWVKVNPTSVPVYNSHFTVWGGGFPANTGVNCWFTRPDGRVLEFINVNAKTDASGSFAVGAALDDFPPYTSSEPGTWYVTCATSNHSYLATSWFTAYALASDP